MPTIHDKMLEAKRKLNQGAGIKALEEFANFVIETCADVAETAGNPAEAILNLLLPVTPRWWVCPRCKVEQVGVEPDSVYDFNRTANTICSDCELAEEGCDCGVCDPVKP